MQIKSGGEKSPPPTFFDEFLLVEAQMLTDEASTREAEKAIESVSSIRKIVKCYHNPNEVSSLLKRVILDKRGNNGKSI